MAEEEKRESGEISRREFLKDAGFIVGGAAIGAGITYPLVPGKETIKEVEVPVEVPVEVKVLKYVCPSDGQEFDTLAALTDHMDSAHPGEVQVITEFTCPYDEQTFSTLAALQSHVVAEHPPEVEVVEVPEEATRLNVNGDTYELDVQPNWTLAFVLREKLGLTGTKVGCDRGACGVCTVLIGGDLVLACMTLAIECDGKDILTIEGLEKDGELDPLQESYAVNDAMQCGFCIPGAIMSSKWLLNNNPNPAEADIRKALSGVLCRCGAYPKMVKAVMEVS